MIVDVFPVCVGGNDKSVFALGKPHCKFIAHLVGFLGGNLTGLERLSNLIGDHIIFLYAPSDKFILPLGKHKIRSTGMGGISADDPAAIEKLQKKLDGLERSQLIMKEVNAYYRKHGKLDGCALLSPDQIEKLKASMASSWRSDPRPFESYQLTNNNAEIRRVKARIEQLSKQAQQEFSGWEFDGGRVEMNREDNRLQVFFDGKPDADTRAELKSSGFRWAPSVGAWQRQLTDNAIRAADRLECIKPLSGEKPSQLQKKPSILQTMREQGEKVQTEPEKKAPSGRDAER